MESTSLLVKSNHDRLHHILNLMINVMPIGIIFNVSKRIDHYDLIVVLDKHCTLVSKNIDVLMESALLHFSNCAYSLHTFSSVSQQIQGGNLFYCTVCVPENVIYKTEATTLQLPCNAQAFKQQALSYHRSFKREMETAIQFLNGAIWYIDHRILGLATFMLHQATELVYRSFLSALGDKVVRTHDLNKLRKYLQRFIPEILGAFDEDEILEVRLLSLLEKAYCDARYHALYQISLSRVNKLLEGVKRLHERAIAAHNNQMFSWIGTLEIEL